MDVKKCDKCLFEFQDTCDKLNIKSVLMIGTCLGFYRDKTYCEGDYDLDVGVFCNKEKIRELIKGLKEKGFREDTCLKNQGWEINHHFWKGDVLLDVHYQFLKDELPFFIKLQPINYKDKVFNMPSPVEDYLKLQYGENWKIPANVRSRPLQGYREIFNGGPDKTYMINVNDYLDSNDERYEGGKVVYGINK